MKERISSELLARATAAERVPGVAARFAVVVDGVTKNVLASSCSEALERAFLAVTQGRSIAAQEVVFVFETGWQVLSARRPVAATFARTGSVYLDGERAFPFRLWIVAGELAKLLEVN